MDRGSSALATPTCVLSVGRSGSSLAARALNLLGVHLGADADLMPPGEQNKLGYWENMKIYRLNEQLLEIFGGSWYRPPLLSPGWERDERLEELRMVAVRVAEELAFSGQKWGFKDPRTVVLLPFWRRVIGVMDYVICVRGPHAFIRSVQALGAPEIEPHITAKLWLDTHAAVLTQTVHERRTFVFYEDWFDDLGAVVRRLATFIHGEGSPLDQEAFGAINAFFDPRLCHADVHGEEMALVVASELDALYAHMRIIAANDPDERGVREHQAFVAQTFAEGYRCRQAIQDDLGRIEERTATVRAETESVRRHAMPL